ncbi:MAG: uracil-DNA glycosylase family protein [Pseudomonadota bacterium]|nr:uracil-DNA glycosylase family protein [Pseudomonadota bacterium]
MVARPEFRDSNSARLYIVGQAPGRRARRTGFPWPDASGKRRRKSVKDTIASQNEYLPCFLTISHSSCRPLTRQNNTSWFEDNFLSEPRHCILGLIQ